MIQAIRILNFQRHKTFELRLSPQCTIIAGKSDSGKSSILRSLRFLLMNHPNGDDFVRKGANQTRVDGRIDNKKLTRIRGKGRNCYILNGKRFDALGSGGVPDEVAKLVNVSVLNFSGQLDPLFLMSSSPGQVSRELNSVINLGAIDSSLSYVAHQIRQAKSEEELTNKRLDEANRRCNDLEWIEKTDQTLQSIEIKQAKADKLVARISSLEKLLKDLMEAKRQTTIRLPDTVLIDSLYTKVKKISGRINLLGELIDKIQEVKNKKIRLNQEVESFADKLNQAFGKNCPLCGNLV
jgi:exonuclease SbcC